MPSRKTQLMRLTRFFKRGFPFFPSLTPKNPLSLSLPKNQTRFSEILTQPSFYFSGGVPMFDLRKGTKKNLLEYIDGKKTF